jgi:hypothetical protein
MIGAALDQHVAGLEQHLALVHQRVDFPRQHDGIVDGVGLVKAGMALVRKVADIALGFGVVR